MLRRGLKTACCHTLMLITHFLKDADQWQNPSPVWCCFLCMICVVEIGMDWSIVAITIAVYFTIYDDMTKITILIFH